MTKNSSGRLGNGIKFVLVFTVVCSLLFTVFFANALAVTKPKIPTGIVVSQVNATSAKLTWKAVSGAKSYEVQCMSGTKWFDDGTSKKASYTSSGLINYSVYYFQVRAINSAGASAWSKPVKFTKAATPAVPTGLSASRASSTSAKLTWRAVSGATSYDVQCKSGTKWFDDGKSIKGASYTSKGLKNYDMYYFRVRAKNVAGTSDWSDEIKFTRVTKPAVPTGLAASKESSTSVRLTWNAVSGATSYDVQCKSGTKWFDDGKSIKSAIYTSKGLKNYDIYYFRVRARNSAGVSDWSADIKYSKKQEGNTPPPSSTNISFPCKLDDLKSIFPEGSYWSGKVSISPADFKSSNILAKINSSVSSAPLCNHKNGLMNCNHWAGTSGGRQCMGFARLVGYMLTKHDVKSDWKKFNKFDDLKVGDYVQLGNNVDPRDHTMIVYKKTDTSITVLDCNQDGKCGISWTHVYQRSVVEKRLYCFYGYRP